MNLGPYEIPETRLTASLVDVRKIYSNVKSQPSTTLTLAKALGYAAPKSGGFYRKHSSMVQYGLLQNSGRGIFQVSKLATDLMFPTVSEEEKRQRYRDAVMNIQLWAELHKVVQKSPPENIFGALSNITKAEPGEIEKYQADIRRWYLEDIALVPDEILRAHNENVKKEDQIDIESNKNLSHAAKAQAGKKVLSFEDVTIQLPEDDLYGAWQRLEQYMKVYWSMHPEAKNSVKADKKNNQGKEKTNSQSDVLTKHRIYP